MSRYVISMIGHGEDTTDFPVSSAAMRAALKQRGRYHFVKSDLRRCAVRPPRPYPVRLESRDQPARRYWSERQGRGPVVEALSFEQLRDLAFVVFDRVIVQEGLADAFGQECPDADDGWLPGRFGDAAERMQIELGRPGLWPHRPNAALYDVYALYDVVEFLHEYISKPVEGTYHSYFRHTHWEEFDRDAGRVEFRDEIN